MLVTEPSGRTLRVKFWYEREQRTRARYMTGCAITTPVPIAGTSLHVDTTVAEGEAYLHPWDNFDRSIGRKLALARALRNAGVPKRTRQLVWDAYWEKHKAPWVKRMLVCRTCCKSVNKTTSEAEEAGWRIAMSPTRDLCPECREG
jgi:hypothetical protein